VQNNYIGTNALGSAALGNGGAGVSIYNNAPNNRIINNVISSNGKDGIYIYGAGTETTVRGNSIGAAADGKTALGNRGNGIYLRTFTDGSIEIGGPIAREGSDISGNTIAYNQGAGVAIAYGRNHDISANAIFSNTGLGIDLDANGVTPNDVGDGDTSVYAVGGANDLQNFPVLTGVFRSSGSTTVQGVLNSTPNRVFGIEFFSNATCDASGYGEGQHFLGRTTVTTNDGGNATFSVELPVTVPEGQFITATATNSMYASTNTSEFSACVAGATPGLVQFSAATYAANENDGAATITVTRTARGSGTVTVKFVTGDGTATSGRDYTSVSGILTFAPGETTKTFTIPITDDFTHEPDETVNLTLSEPTNGALLGNPATAVLTIRDNDAGRSSIFLPLVQR
jgi:parallel beta-helix repeat protein